MIIVVIIINNANRKLKIINDGGKMGLFNSIFGKKVVKVDNNIIILGIQLSNSNWETLNGVWESRGGCHHLIKSGKQGRK
jgi:hypothetical protein